MRLEQLVLFGPEDDFRVPFGSRVTVLAGMRPQDRAGLIQTLVEAMSGKLQGASVIYVDHAGRRVFADRNGATYAEGGDAAPSLEELLGSDPDVVAKQVTLRAEDLGLGGRATIDAITDELAGARSAVERLEAERDHAEAMVIQIDAWRAEMAHLDELIERSEEDTDRWAWMQLRSELDGVRAALAAFQDDEEQPDDSRLLDAVDKLRDVGETWAEAGGIVEELQGRLVPLPDVSEDDLARVARTPGAMPRHFDEHAEAWQNALELVAQRKAELGIAVGPAPVAEDGIVEKLAKVDQKELWLAHHRLRVARQTYEAELVEMKDRVDPNTEADIESAHVEVLRCRRNVQRRFIPGALGSAILSVGALFAGQELNVAVGVVMLLAAIGMGTWLLVAPRRELGLAEREEEMALASANADSWLGLHLRRVDEITERADRKRLDAATDAHATAQLDWEEIAERIDPDLAYARRDQIEAHARAISPELRAEAVRHARTDLSIAIEDESLTRTLLTEGIEAYGLTPEGLADLDAQQLREVLERRIGAGQLARDTQELHLQQKRAAIAATEMDHLLAELGFDDGDLSGRLDRAIEAIGAARARAQAAQGQVDRAELEAQATALSALVEAGRRPSWDSTPDPTTAPADPEDLVARRGELSQLIVDAGHPDVADIERRLVFERERTESVAARLAEQTEGLRPLHTRIADRIARTTWLGDHEESLPVLVDDPFDDLSEQERIEVLELLTRLSVRTQIVVLTADPVIARWARANAGSEDVTLLEADHVAV